MKRGYIGLRFFVAAIVLLFYVLFFGQDGQGATPHDKKPPREWPKVGYQDNIYQYLYGSVQDVTIFQRDGKVYTNLTVHPVKTYLLFSQSVTFCGDHRDKLGFTTNDTVIFIYSKVMHQMDCYDLERIDVIDKAHTSHD